MNIDKNWLLQHLTQEELMMFYNIASLDSHYKYFDLDTIQAVNPRVFAQKFLHIQPLVNEEGKLILESLKSKLVEFESSYVQ